MTIPLQPMSTAPRDGSEVLLVTTAYSRLTLDRISARWSIPYKAWAIHFGYLDEANFSGWLDIKALARDSARLQWLIDHNAAAVTTMKGMSSVVVNVGTTGEAWVSEEAVSDPRAAIDKEAEHDR